MHHVEHQQGLHAVIRESLPGLGEAEEGQAARMAEKITIMRGTREYLDSLGTHGVLTAPGAVRSVPDPPPTAGPRRWPSGASTDTAAAGGLRARAVRVLHPRAAGLQRADCRPAARRCGRR